MKHMVIRALQSPENLHEVINKVKEDIAEVNKQREERERQIKQDILKVLPHCNVHVFGSQLTGLATKDSDFDIYIDYDKRSYNTDLSKEIQSYRLEHIEEVFVNRASGFAVHYVLTTPRVPILRMIYVKTRIPCDVTCRSGLSVESSILIRQLLTSDFRVSWLVITVRWWMYANDLLNKAKFNSHTTTWLVFFFLMNTQPKVLSSISDMKRGCPSCKIGYWNCGFDRNFYSTKPQARVNKQKRISLLTDFFNFYANFNFKNFVLCPLTATAIPRKDFESLSLPRDHFTEYINVMRIHPNAERLKIDTPVCFQDALDLSLNIAKDLKPVHLEQFHCFCAWSARLCDEWEL